MKKPNWKVLAFSFFAVYAVAFLGSVLTSSSVNSQWYNSIKPSITPPNFVFPIVWNILFFLIAISLYLSWTSAKNKNEKKSIAIVFGINLFLNFLWSVIFFGFKNSYLAFFELIFLWLSIAAMIFTTYRISKTASYLLIPYLVWVSFAGILNYIIAFR
ncbi:tryptophan-rich sensory protein [Candidatus Pacearchaeota archaeon]|nr:tryptophan-rich sensory protein [Candidatus Pacearchaeota archaeon]